MKWQVTWLHGARRHPDTLLVRGCLRLLAWHSWPTQGISWRRWSNTWMPRHFVSTGLPDACNLDAE